MVKNVLVLGASGTVGTAVFKLLSCEKDLNTIGTYFSANQEDTPSLIRFSVEFPNDINSILKQVHPDIVISNRKDIPSELIWTTKELIQYLCSNRKT